MIKMHNGATVWAASVERSESGALRGTVLAQSTDGEWVTWEVVSDETGFWASAGRYFDDDAAEAREDYLSRR
ncbi:hypothetical protein [Jiangella anatolica]|uniref:hypothetical protein n=1 Tax=Jiangella anatolica TaxID=2670374 RepID=UPI0011B6A056|nr:hypothetical protein [Jiangella anatolica]